MVRIILFALLFIGPVTCIAEADPLRLDHSVVPRAQKIALTLNPDEDTYHGEVRIEIDITDKTDSFRLHARDIEIENISLRSETVSLSSLEFSSGEKGIITVTATDPLEPGTYTLSLRFSNEYSHQGTGIYKVEYEGKNYLFTQMEPEYARQSFPCWDAPEFKIPWTLELTVPNQFKVYANTPEHDVSLMKTSRKIRYEQSKPMASYLVAFVIGDFEEVKIPGLSTEGRIVVPAGKTELASAAARISAPLLATLENYFERPYPYRKLDQVAVPEFVYGAMENVGLITYRDTALLRDSKALDLGQKQWQALTIAHEMSHMWFGNLVTPKWWDDLWLNESFASWIALKTVNQTFPEYEMNNEDIKSRQKAFEDDALSTSRPIRRPIAASDAMDHLFDRLAYNKGMAVLDMIEDWMGPEQFRQGMIQYMTDRAWSNADAFNLAESLGEVAEGEILDIMTSFVTQAGIPLLTIERIGDAEIRISQTRYSQYGVEYEEDPLWTVPVVLKYGNDDTSYTRKLLLSQSGQTFKLEHAAEWIYPNENEKGYYRWHLVDASPEKLAGKVHHLNIRNRMGFIRNTEALFSAGLLNGGDFIQTMVSFSGDSSPEVCNSVAECLNGLAGGLIPPELEMLYGRYLHTVLQPMLDEIGMEKQPDEDALIEKLRSALIDALGWRCRDEAVMKTAVEKAQAYINDPYSVDPSLVTTYLRLAALNGDASLFEAYVAEFETATVPLEKQNYLRGLSGFRNKELMIRALDYALSEHVPQHQFGTIPYSLTDRDDNRRLVFDWLRENYPAIQKKIPERSISYLPWLICGQSSELMNDAQTFFMAEERWTQGLEIELGKAAAVFELNAKLRVKELENIRHFLEKGASIDAADKYSE